jgi:hypothetical protein
MPEDVIHHRRSEIVEEEEDDDDVVLSGDEDGDGDGDDMMMNPLEDFLVSDDGDNVANVLAKGLDRVCQQLDVQNKIFVKLYSVLTKIAGSKA